MRWGGHGASGRPLARPRVPQPSGHSRSRETGGWVHRVPLVGWRQPSWRKIDRHRLSTRRVFQTRAAILECIESQRPGGSCAVQRPRQMEPEQTRGRLAGPTKASFLEGKFDLPIGGGGLRREEGQGSLAELHPGASIRIDGEQKFARERRSFSPASPEGLAFAEMPARFGEIDRGQRRQRAAGGENGAKEKENKMTQPSRPPTGGPAEGLSGRGSALGCFFQDYARE